MGGIERALKNEIEATAPRRTTVLYARVDGGERLRAEAARRSVRTALRPLASVAVIDGQVLREVAWRDAASRILAAQKSTAAPQAAALRLSYRGKILLRRRDSDFVTMGRDPGMDIVIDAATAS